MKSRKEGRVLIVIGVVLIAVLALVAVGIIDGWMDKPEMDFNKVEDSATDKNIIGDEENPIEGRSALSSGDPFEGLYLNIDTIDTYINNNGGEIDHSVSPDSSGLGYLFMTADIVLLGEQYTLEFALYNIAKVCDNLGIDCPEEVTASDYILCANVPDFAQLYIDNYVYSSVATSLVFDDGDDGIRALIYVAGRNNLYIDDSGYINTDKMVKSLVAHNLSIEPDSIQGVCQVIDDVVCRNLFSVGAVLPLATNNLIWTENKSLYFNEASFREIALDKLAGKESKDFGLLTGKGYEQLWVNGNSLYIEKLYPVVVIGISVEISPNNVKCYATAIYIVRMSDVDYSPLTEDYEFIAHVDSKRELKPEEEFGLYIPFLNERDPIYSSVSIRVGNHGVVDYPHRVYDQIGFIGQPGFSEYQILDICDEELFYLLFSNEPFSVPEESLPFGQFNKLYWNVDEINGLVRAHFDDFTINWSEYSSDSYYMDKYVPETYTIAQLRGLRKFEDETFQWVIYNINIVRLSIDNLNAITGSKHEESAVFTPALTDEFVIFINAEISKAYCSATIKNMDDKIVLQSNSSCFKTDGVVDLDVYDNDIVRYEIVSIGNEELFNAIFGDKAFG